MNQFYPNFEVRRLFVAPAVIAVVVIASFAFTSSATANVSSGLVGTTGKISGTVTDAATGDPLIGASVIVEGTKLGARTNVDGDYSILNVPPGTYRVKSTYVGYQDRILANVRVSIDLTSKADFSLSTKEVQAKEIVVTAERPLVTKDLTSSQAVVGAEEISRLPVQDVNQVVELQAGIVDGRFRGGRKGEVAYLVDGISVTDVFNGNQGRENSTGVEPQAIQEIQVISGAFNAEYGQAMSGVVNIVTKDGGERYSGSLSGFTGDFTTFNNNIRFGDAAEQRLFPNGLSNTGAFEQVFKTFSPLAERNLEASFSGPAPGLKDQLSFYANGRYFANDGRFFGIRKFATDDFLPERTDLGLTGGNRIRRPDGTYQNLPGGDSSDAIRAFDYSPFGSGDGQVVRMDPYRKLSGLFKLTYRPTGSLKIAASLLASDENYRNYDEAFQLSPDGVPFGFRNSNTAIVNATQTLTTNTFLNLSASRLFTRERSYLYEDPLDARYTLSSGYTPLSQSNAFIIGGTNKVRYGRTTETYGFKADITSQIDQTNQVRGGVEVRIHSLTQLTQNTVVDEAATQSTGILTFRQAQESFQDIFGGNYQYYSHRPLEFSAFLQDKLEFKNFTVNAGLRVDYFQPDGIVPVYADDPGLYDAFRPERQAKDIATRLAEDYTAAPTNFQISPRLGIAVPVTDRSIVHFSYGFFFQIPNFSLLYQDPYFLSSPTRTQTVYGPFGNAALRPQKTTKGEIGLQQQFGTDLSIDISIFFNDIRDLTGSAQITDLFGGVGSYGRFVNTDFGQSRGFVVSITRRFAGNFNFNLDYTFLIAEGNSSDPSSALTALRSDPLAPPPTNIIPLDWDQRHTLNFSLAYQANNWLGSLIARYGSGFPYTPPGSLPDPTREEISTGYVLTNTQRTPSSLGLDLRAQRDFQVGGFTANVYL
ncbi:MAG: TonB-dependent receptor, partial [Rhizobacter sp.]|nr:TonB-dependent receptor [Chlorobiales bacterium]